MCYQLFVPLGVGREQAPRSSGSGLAKIVAGTASPRLLVTGLHIIELPRNLRNGHLGLTGWVPLLACLAVLETVGTLLDKPAVAPVKRTLTEY